MLRCCRQYGYLMGAVVPLQRATRLTSLNISNLGDSYSLMYLPLLTQLRELALKPCDDSGDFFLAINNPPRAPLAAMTDLLSLKVFKGFGLSQREVDEEDLPLLLPPNLERLHVEFWSDTPSGFWRHIAGCTALVRLHLESSPRGQYEVTKHPSWLLHTLARRLGRLQHLHLQGSPQWDDPSPDDLQQVLALLASTAAAQQQQEQHGWDWQQVSVPVLGPGDLHQHTCDHHMLLPPPNMGGLSALQTLQASGVGLGENVLRLGLWLMYTCCLVHDGF